MKTLLSLFMNLLLLAAFMASALFALSYRDYEKPGPLQQTVLFAVERGQGVSVIADNLAKQGVITQPLLFKIAARLTDKHTGLHAGEYEFPAGVSMREVLDKMDRGEVYQRRITVAEGLTSWQIVQLLNAAQELTGEITEIPPEGTLLPETYNYQRGDTRAGMLAKMKEAMIHALHEVAQQKKETAPMLSEAEMVILASIVEKETAVGSERNRIAGVFLNRLKQGMKLQTDPTVIYAITGGRIQDQGQGPLGRRLLSKDLQFESPYNTYKYPGLPPGPIANPGKASLEAVMNPEQHDFIYFVADGTGGHVFAATLEEHNSNVAKWRDIRKQQGN